MISCPVLYPHPIPIVSTTNLSKNVHESSLQENPPLKLGIGRAIACWHFVLLLIIKLLIIKLYREILMTLHSLLEMQGIIHCDPEIMSGVPVFRGTRVPLQTLFDYLEDDEGLDDFINDFPYLKSQTMKVLENAAKLLVEKERSA